MTQLVLIPALLMVITVQSYVSEAAYREVTVSSKLIDISSLDLSGFVYTYGSPIACMKTCLEEDCFSVFYWNTDRKCRINYSGYNDLTEVDKDSDLHWFVLKDPTQYTFYDGIGIWLIYRHGSKTWRSAEADCNSQTPQARLFKIDSQAKQDVAKALVQNSGNEFIHIGVYHQVIVFPPSSQWKYSDGTPLVYSSWAPAQPLFITYAAMQRLFGYDWVVVDPLLITGGWICERYT